MMAVSCTKALLVVLFFMHVKYEANWKYVLTIPASLMAVFLVLALVPDVGARVNGMFGVGGKYSEERLSRVGNQEDVRLMTDASKHLAESGHEGSHEGSQRAIIDRTASLDRSRFSSRGQCVAIIESLSPIVSSVRVACFMNDATGD